jgi:outer membrane protein OmpA-like peptidoglycan-associated protein
MQKIDKLLLPLLLVLTISMPALAQNDAGKQARPKDRIELGLTPSYMFVTGDVPAKGGYGVGLHLRKALDYVFSVRLEGVYGKMKGDNESSPVDLRTFDSNWLSGTFSGILSFNNFRFDRDKRSTNIYALIGAGVNSFKTTYRNEQVRNGTIQRELASHGAIGAGITFRLGPSVNIGVEHQVFIPFGRRADLIDGTERENEARTPFADNVHRTSLVFNVNLGSATSKSEPLYWVSPNRAIADEARRISKEVVDEAVADSDGDGVIDAIDTEPNTPAEAIVDTKGRTMDSDRDGVADHLDKEPYYTPRAGETVDANGVVVNPVAGAGVSEDRVREIINEELDRRGYVAGGSGGVSNVASAFLPMIHFPTDGYTIKYSDYGTLASIGQMLQDDPNLRLAIVGHTDQTGAESYNDELSYLRAKAVVDHLVNNFGIGRGRLVLQWRGKEEALVPLSSSYMNRRVSFRIAAPSDREMDPPANLSPGGY